MLLALSIQLNFIVVPILLPNKVIGILLTIRLLAAAGAILLLSDWLVEDALDEALMALTRYQAFVKLLTEMVDVKTPPVALTYVPVLVIEEL